MKQSTTIILFLSSIALMFFLGRCSKNCQKLEPTPVVEVTSIDTTSKTANLNISPIPKPVDTLVRTIYVSKADAETIKLLERQKKELEYFRKVVEEKERVISDIQSGIAVGGAEIAAEPEKGNALGAIEPNGHITVEGQNINLYRFSETDSATNVRLEGTIGVLGFLSESFPPSFALHYPEYLTTLMKSTPQQPMKSRNRAVGLMAGFHQQIGGRERQRASLTVYRRVNWFTYGASGSLDIDGASEGALGVNLGVEF